MTDLFTYAEEQAQAGMAKSLETAEAIAHPFWGEIAFQFLCKFAETHSEPFISEDVSDASKLDPGFQQPHDDRAWGRTYRRAVEEGIIARVGAGKSRRRHHSICPLWQSLICERREAAE